MQDFTEKDGPFICGEIVKVPHAEKGRHTYILKYEASFLDSRDETKEYTTSNSNFCGESIFDETLISIIHGV